MGSAIRDVATRPVARLRVDRHELSGAFGDSGVLFPLAASLIAINGLNPTTVFVGAGVFYVAAALYFRLPMPVQPLKAFSAIAIAPPSRSRAPTSRSA